MSGPELIFATAALSALRAVEDGRAVEAGQETSASNAERDAAIAAQRGETNANEARRRGSARQATQRARLDLQGQISAEAEFDALRRADAGNLTALNQLTRAQAFRRRGAAVRRAGLFEAGATLLGGLR